MTKSSKKRTGESAEAAKMDDDLRKYALGLGYLAYEWNQLQEEFGRIFDTILDAKHNYAAPAIWHSIPSDRLQRQILKRLLNKTCTRDRSEYYKSVVKELIWAIGAVDNRYSDRRNNAIHTPMMFWGDEITFMPDSTFLNERAIHLHDKNILEEMASDVVCLNMIHSFICELHARCSERGSEKPLPQRPPLPGHRNSRGE